MRSSFLPAIFFRTMSIQLDPFRTVVIDTKVVRLTTKEHRLTPQQEAQLQNLETELAIADKQLRLVQVKNRLPRPNWTLSDYIKLCCNTQTELPCGSTDSPRLRSGAGTETCAEPIIWLHWSGRSSILHWAPSRPGQSLVSDFRSTLAVRVAYVRTPETLDRAMVGHQIAGGLDDRLPQQELKDAPDAIDLALKFFAEHPLG
jgi:hypothetical protein